MSSYHYCKQLILAHHKSTGVSPNLMMLGRKVHQLTDIVFKDTDAIRESVDIETYLERLKYALETAHSVERWSLQICQYKQKRLYDLRLLNHQYEIGDLV